jgi:hypothetical protein
MLGLLSSRPEELIYFAAHKDETICIKCLPHDRYKETFSVNKELYLNIRIHLKRTKVDQNAHILHFQFPNIPLSNALH